MNYKPHIFCLLLLITLKLNAQVDFKLGLAGSLSKNIYLWDRGNPWHPNESQIHFGTSIQFGMSFQDKFLVRSGIGLRAQGYEIHNDWYIPTIPVRTSAQDPSIPYDTYVDATYLSIPFEIGYRFGLNERIKLIPMIGSEIMLMLNKSEYSKYGDGHVNDSDFYYQDLNSILIQFNFILGVEFNFWRSVSLNIEPYVGKGLNKFDEIRMEAGHYTWGLSIGINMKVL